MIIKKNLIFVSAGVLSALVLLAFVVQTVFAAVTIGGSGSNQSFTLTGSDSATSLHCDGLRRHNNQFFIGDGLAFRCDIGSSGNTKDHGIYFQVPTGSIPGRSTISGATLTSSTTTAEYYFTPDNVSTGTTSTSPFEQSDYQSELFSVGSRTEGNNVITNRTINTVDYAGNGPLSFIIYGVYRLDGSSSTAGSEFKVTDAMTVYSVHDDYSITLPRPGNRVYQKDEAISPYDLPSATGGFTPYVYVITGTLPPGLTYSASNNRITGTPTTEGTYNLTFHAVDVRGIVSEKDFNIRVEALSIATPSISPSGKAQSKTIATSVTPNTATLTYQFIGGSATCDSSTTGTFSTYPSAGVVANTEARNGQKVCFKGVSGSTTKYLASAAISDIDRTAPTISGTSVTTSNSNSSFAKQGDTITVSYTASEELKATSPAPTANLLFPGNITHTVNLSKGSGNTYSGTHTIGSDITTDGIINYRINRVQDLAGNERAQGSQTATTITVDTTAPTVSNYTYATNNSSSTHAKVGDTITVTFDASETLSTTPSVSIAGDSATVTNSGNAYTAVVTIGSSTTEGEAQVDIGTITDEAGNTTDPSAEDTGVTVDRTAPSLGTLSWTLTGEQVVSSRSYLNLGDSFAFSLPVIEELQETSLTVYLKNFEGTPSTRTITFTRNASNKLLYENTYTIATGDNTGNNYLSWVSGAQLTDIAGNTTAAAATTPTEAESESGSEIEYIFIDTTPPDAPSVPDLASADDSCYKRPPSTTCTFGTDSDNITSSTSNLDFSVSREAQATVQFKNGTTDFGSLVSRGSSTTASLSGQSLAEGQHSITAVQTDRAGNASPASAVLLVNVDTTNPVLSTIPATRTFPDLASSYDSGVSNSDDLTNLSEIKFEEYSIFGDLSGGVTNEVWMRAPGSSNHSYAKGAGGYTSNNPSDSVEYAVVDQSALTLNTDGVHNIEFHYVDLAGNKSTSPSLDIHYDSTIQEVPIDLKAASDSGASNTDNVTNITTPTITLSQLESSADPVTGTGKANVTVYNWTGTSSFLTTPDSADLTELFSLTDVDSTSKDVQFGTDAGTSALTDDIYKLVTKHEDDAGNVIWSAYAKVQDRNAPQHVVIDTTPPPSPSRPDLHSADDSFGVNANIARDGTDRDDITNARNNLSFRSYGSGSYIADNDGNGGATDQHQIRFYQWIDDAVGNEAGDRVVDIATAGIEDTELTELIAPTAIRGASNIIDALGSGYEQLTEGGVANPYFTSTVLTNRSRDADLFTTGSNNLSTKDGYYYFVAKQYDVAGNLSPVSQVYSFELDTSAPSRITGTLKLHPSSDTGASATDKQTSNTTPVFRLDIDQPSVSSDIDYFELRRVQFDDDFETIGSLTYPSSASNVEQGSYEYFNPNPDVLSSPSNPRTELDASYQETGETVGDGAYSDGVTVAIFSQQVPAFNTWYGYKIYAVDLAGNAREGVDYSNIRILIPPPKPSQTDLANASDTSREGYSAGSTDNITKATTWTLEGSYQNTTSVERTNDAAGGVEEVRVTIQAVDSANQPLPSASPVVITFEKTDSDGDTTNDITSTGTGATAIYEYSKDINLLSDDIFGSSLEDGYYSITAQAFNQGGEGGTLADALVVTLDRQEPTPNDGLTLRSDRSYVAGGNNSIYFRVSDPNNKEPNGAVIITPRNGEQIYSTDDEVIAIGSEESFDGNTSYSEDLSGYLANFYDVAGNGTGNIDIPLESRAPFITSYILNQAANRYLVVANTQSDNSDSSSDDVLSALIEPAKRFTQAFDSAFSANICRFAPTTAADRGYPTEYELTAPIVDTTSTQCIGVDDGYGNTSAVHIVAEKSELISDSEVADDDDHGRDANDNVTNVRTFTYTGRTLAGTTGRVLVKTSTSSFPTTGDPLPEGVAEYTFSPAEGNIDENGVFTVEVSVSADDIYAFQGYVTNTILGANEIGPILLESVSVDTVVPSAPTALDLASVDDSQEDAGAGTGTQSDDITKRTTDLSVSVNAETNSLLKLYDGSQPLTHADSVVSGSATTIPNTGVPTTAAKVVDIDLSSDGTHPITATAEDLAGNVSPQSDALSITIDTTPPEITVLRLNDEDTTIDSNTRFIAVATDENPEPASYLEIKENVTKAVCDAYPSIPNGTDSSPSLGAVYDPSDSATGLCFVYFDLAGNIGFKHSDDAIEGVGNLAMTDRTKVGTTFYTKSGSVELTGVTAGGAKVLIKFDTATATPSAYTDAQRKDLSFADFNFDVPTGTADFTQTVSVPSSADGGQIVGWIWTDSADAETVTPAISLGSVVVDDTPPAYAQDPVLTTSNTSGGLSKQGDTLTLTFRSNELLSPTGAEVLIANEPANCGTLPTGNPTTTDIVCTLTLSNSATEGPASHIVRITDLAGNQSTYPEVRNDSIIVDATAPTLTIAGSSSSAYVTTGETLTLTLRLNDANGVAAGTYTFTIGGVASSSCVITASGGETNLESNCPATVIGGVDGAALTLTSPQLSDIPGNTNTPAVENVYHLDTTAPVISNATYDTAQRKRFTLSLDAIHNQNAASGSSETLTPRFTGDCSSAFTGTTRWTDETPADATAESYSHQFRATKGTYSTCTVALVDEVGNVSNELTLPEFTVRGSAGGGFAKALFSFFSGSPEERVKTEVVQADISTTAPTTPVAQDSIVHTPAPVFSVDRARGSRGEDIRQLQMFLNENGYTVSTSGAGSTGQETTYFGPATQRALEEYQRSQGLPITGSLDAPTRARIDTQQQPQTQPPVPEVHLQEARQGLITSLRDRIRDLMERIRGMVSADEQERSVEPTQQHTTQPTQPTTTQPTLPAVQRESERVIVPTLQFAHPTIVLPVQTPPATTTPEYTPPTTPTERDVPPTQVQEQQAFPMLPTRSTQRTRTYGAPTL